MKLRNTIAIALWGICSGSAFVCASGDIYADYTVNEPAAVAVPAEKEDPAMLHWVNRFADACALMMGGEKKQSVAAAEIFCDLLEEQPDSDDALYLLDQTVQNVPDLKKKIAERIWNIAEKHPGSPAVTGYAALLGYELKHSARFCQFLPVAIRAVTAKPLKQEDGKTAQARLLVLLNAVHAALENQIHGLGPEIQNLYKSDPVLFQGRMATLDLVFFLEACMQDPALQTSSAKIDLLFLFDRILENFQTVYLNTDLEKEDAQQQHKWRNAARFVFSTSRGGELAEALKKSLAEKPAQKEYTMLLAFYYLTNASWKEAEDLLQTYLRDRKDKTNPAWVYQLRMFMYRQLQNNAKYLEAARSYIHYESDLRNTESARWEIASEMIEQKDYDAAQQVLAPLRSFHALAYRMTLLHQLERYDQVYQIAKLAVPMFARGERMKKREHTLDFLQIAAYAADEKGDLPMLETLYLTWLKDYPEDPLAANNLAYAYATRNIKLDEAEKLALIALKTDPESSVAQDTMAWIHYRAGRYTVAATYIEIAIASSKKENDGFVGAEILDHAGDIYLALNDKENARKYWELALKNSVSKKEKEQIRKKLAALNRNK